MTRGKKLRAGGTEGPAKPTQGLRQSVSQHAWNTSVTHKYVNTYNRASRVGAEGKDIYGPFGDSRTTSEHKIHWDLATDLWFGHHGPEPSRSKPDLGMWVSWLTALIRHLILGWPTIPVWPGLQGCSRHVTFRAKTRTPWANQEAWSSTYYALKYSIRKTKKGGDTVSTFMACVFVVVFPGHWRQRRQHLELVIEFRSTVYKAEAHDFSYAMFSFVELFLPVRRGNSGLKSSSMTAWLVLSKWFVQRLHWKHSGS